MVSRDDRLTAARLAVGPDDDLPQVNSDAAFDRLDANGNRVGSNTLRLPWLGRDTLQMSESEAGQREATSDLQRSAAGWVRPGIPAVNCRRRWRR